MKNQIKTAVLAAVSVASLATITHAQQSLGGIYTQGDLLAGFTSGSGNDLVLNLGTESSVQSGQFWDLTSLLGSSLPGNLGNPATVEFGVIGDSAGPNTIFTTSAGTPNHFASQTGFNSVNTAINSAGGLVGSSGFGTPAETSSGSASWFGQTIGGGTGTIKNNYGNPDGLTGQTTVNFYSVAQGTAGAETLMDTFTLSINGSGDEILTVNAVPEPSTTVLASFAGLIGLWARARRKLA